MVLSRFLVTQGDRRPIYFAGRPLIYTFLDTVRIIEVSSHSKAFVEQRTVCAGRPFARALLPQNPVRSKSFETMVMFATVATGRSNFHCNRGTEALKTLHSVASALQNRIKTTPWSSKCTRFRFLYSLRIFRDKNHEQLMRFKATETIVGFDCMKFLVRHSHPDNTPTRSFPAGCSREPSSLSARVNSGSAAYFVGDLVTFVFFHAGPQCHLARNPHLTRNPRLAHKRGLARNPCLARNSRLARKTEPGPQTAPGPQSAPDPQ